jgi:Ca-activated chloride channel family protein
MWPLPPEIIDNFHFLRPVLLLGLIPALVLFLLLHFLQSSQSNWSRAIDPQLLPYLLDKSFSAKQGYPLYGLLLVWTLGILAAAGPVWDQIPVPVQEREDALVVVADMSLSMYSTDLSPNRSTRLQRKILDILEFRRQEGQTGLVVYAGDAHTVTPMTDDVETIGNLVPSLQPNIMPTPGSKPAKGVLLATELLANSNLTQARILLLTDGIENTDIQEITSVLAGTGHTLSVMGFGTEAGAPIPNGQQGYLRDSSNAIVIPRLERASLQQLVSRTRGRYTDAQLTDEDVRFLLEASLLEEGENLVDVEDREFDSWYETGPWLLLLALPFAALAFRRGWLLVLLLAIGLLPSAPTYAWEWRDLWERKDQQGNKAFAQEDFTTAAETFRDPQWRAAANYRSENFEGVIQDLALIDTPEAHYNRGNALAKLGMFPQAIEAYERTLAFTPGHADALQNKELVEKLLEEQEKEQQQNNEGDQQQQGNDQQQQEQQEQQDQQQQNQQNQNQNQDQQQQDQQQQDQEQQRQDENQKKEEQESEEQDQERKDEQEQQEQQQSADNQKPETEEEQAMQQWLMRIPDDPGELLRNKFRYQTQQRVFEQLQNPDQSQREASEKIW